MRITRICFPFAIYVIKKKKRNRASHNVVDVITLIATNIKFHAFFIKKKTFKLK